MKPHPTETLTTVFSDVLVNMAFMFTDEDGPDALLGTTWMEATISYHGPASGTLRLQCTTEFGGLLAADLLGIDHEDEDARLKGEDAVKEFMNIVCGQCITEMHGTENVFDLSIPQSRALTEAPDVTIDEVSSVSVLIVEGHRVQLMYTPDDNVDCQ